MTDPDRDPATDASTSPLGSLRRDYRRAELLEDDVDADPIAQFQRWFDEAMAAGVAEPNAMTLATASPSGEPSARIVLLKGLGPDGFVFFTSYDSAKGREMAANPRAALVFFWKELERQVRIEGDVSQVSAEESDTYFHSRPRGSQLGAIASRQSASIPSRATLDQRLAEAEGRYADREIPRPDTWGGYRVAPRRIEFWQGRPNRLHDRILFRREGGAWVRERLSP